MVFEYAIASGWRTDNPAVAVSKVLQRRRGQKKHHPAMAYGKLPAFIQAFRASTADTVTRLGLEFLVLTAARTGEVRFMEWGAVDTEAATWTVPAPRMKARREHRVPLSGRALAILEEARSLGTGAGIVFPSRKGKPLSNMAFTMLLRRLEAGDAVPHGFRSTFKDWTLEQTTFSWAVVETALAHTLGSATESAYARSDLFDRRRELMETWAKHCERGGSISRSRSCRSVRTCGEASPGKAGFGGVPGGQRHSGPGLAGCRNAASALATPPPDPTLTVFCRIRKLFHGSGRRFPPFGEKPRRVWHDAWSNA